MKGQYSFTNVITQRKSTTSRKKVQFFEEANQNVQNMISDILLTIDEDFPPLSSKVPPTIKILDIIISFHTLCIFVVCTHLL
jgi:hypothetical protein